MADPALVCRITSSLHADLSALLGMYAVMKTNPDQKEKLEEIKQEILRLYSEIALHEIGERSAC